MGEKIKILAAGEILKNKFEIELNHPLSFEKDQ